MISVQPLFYAKNYSQTSKSLAVGVKYKYANPYIITQELNHRIMKYQKRENIKMTSVI